MVVDAAGRNEFIAFRSTGGAGLVSHDKGQSD